MSLIMEYIVHGSKICYFVFYFGAYHLKRVRRSNTSAIGLGHVLSHLM